MTTITQAEKDWALIAALKMALEDGDNFFFEDEDKDMQAREFIEELIEGESK